MADEKKFIDDIPESIHLQVYNELKKKFESKPTPEKPTKKEIDAIFDRIK